VGNFDVKHVLGLVIVFALLAYVGMPASGAILNDKERNINQSVDEQYTVVGNVTTNVTDTTAGSAATYRLSDRNTTQTKTITEGSTQTFQMSDGDIDVTLNNATANSADTTYTYDSMYTWDGGPKGLAGALVVFFFLAVAVMIAAPVIDM